MSLDRVVLWYVVGLSIYHVGTGTISYFAPEAAMRFYRGAYGCDPVERRHLTIILRPWGALALFAGIIGLGVVWLPASRPWVEAALFVLLILRIGYRVRLREELRAISGIPPKRNAANVALLAAGAFLLAADIVVNGHLIR